MNEAYTEAAKEAFALAPSGKIMYHTLEINHPANQVPLELETVSSADFDFALDGAYVEKTGGGAAWTAAVNSVGGYTGGARVRFTAATAVGYAYMVGLNSDPNTNESWTSLDYAIYCNAGNLIVYESGLSVYTGPSFVIGDEIEIIYNGDEVIYLKNDVEFYRSNADFSNETLYVDTSFNTVGSRIENLTFKPNTNSVYLVKSRNDLTAVLEDGNTVTFNASGFDFTLPSAGRSGVYSMNITIGNPNRIVSDYLQRALGSNIPVKVFYRPYLSDDLTAPQLVPPLELALKDIDISELDVSGTCTFDDLVNRKAPNTLYDYTVFRSLGL